MTTHDVLAPAAITGVRARDDMDQLCINTIRTLSMDAVQAAKSGHPGTPMALAPVAYCLWQRIPAFRPGAIPSGRIATASSSQRATRRCCCIRCCTSPASRR